MSNFITTLRNLYLSSKLSLKYARDQLFFPFGVYKTRILYLDAKRTLQTIQSTPYAPSQSQKIVYIGTDEDRFAWTLDTDFRLGGNSHAEISTEDGASKFYLVLLKGELRFYKELDYEGHLYCDITSTMLVKRLFRESNGIRVNIKSDGNNYVLGLVVRENMGMQWYKALIHDRTQEWIQLEIPLFNMITDDDKKDVSIKLEFDPLHGVRIAGVTLGIYSYDKTEGIFEIRIKNIEMIYKEEFENLPDKYPHPIMFSKINSTTVDIGGKEIGLNKK